MNSTTMTTVLGIAQAVGAEVVNYIVHNNMDGGAWSQPTHWIGLIVAALMGAKAYYTQGIPQPTPAPLPGEVKQPGA